MSNFSEGYEFVPNGSQNTEKIRFEKMKEMRVAGFTLQFIANKFDLTRERVRQILLKSSNELKISDLRATKKLKNQQDIWNYVMKNWEQIKLFTIDELASEVLISQSKLRQILSPYHSTFLIANEINNLEKKFSDEDCINSLKVAQTYCFPLTTKSYSKLIAAGDVNGPSVPLILNRFGSWRGACKVAGVEAGEAVRNLYDQQFSDHDILRHIRRFMFEQVDAGWSLDRYVKWREQKSPDAPSIASVRNRIGNWPQARVAALRLHMPEYNMENFLRPKFND